MVFVLSTSYALFTHATAFSRSQHRSALTVVFSVTFASSLVSFALNSFAMPAVEPKSRVRNAVISTRGLLFGLFAVLVALGVVLELAEIINLWPNGVATTQRSQQLTLQKTFDAGDCKQRC